MQLSKNTSPKGKNVFLSVFFACTSSQPAFEATFAKRKLVGVPGVEPGTSSLSGTRSNQLSYTPSPPRSPPPAFAEWWRQPGSNRRHPACKAGALPTELCPRGDVYLDARSSADSDRSRGPEGMRKTYSCSSRIDVRDVSVSATPKGVSPSPAPCGAAAP